MMNLTLINIPLFLGWFFLPFSRFLFANSTHLIEQWKGEYFHEKEGGFYLHLELETPEKSILMKGDGSTFQVTLVNLLTRESYRFNPTPLEATSPPKEIWKIHSGKYLIKSIEKVDPKGSIRKYRPKNTHEAKSFIVKRLSLSNLGVWRVAPIRDTGLDLKTSMLPNRYSETGPAGESAVRQIIDGYTGNFQAAIAGQKSASQNIAKSHLRTTVTTQRQLAMYYKLNLFKHNHYAKSMSETLTVYDTAMRQCFTDRMNQTGEDIKGQIHFTFLLTKSSGTLTKLKKSGGDIQDQELIRCLSLKLQSIQFNPVTSMIGELSYTFDIK